MIQDIYPHQFSNDFVVDSGVSENDYIFHFSENTLLMKQSSDVLMIPQRKDLEGCSAEGIFIFTFNNTNCYLVSDVPQT